MKYYNYDIVFQEIPDEVTLAINLTNCPNLCEGCHSPHLRKDIGEELTPAVVDQLLSKYASSVSCLCFMGGDAHRAELSAMAQHLRNHSKVKIGWYSGQDKMPEQEHLFDYVKLGGYNPAKGSLKSRTTNQRLYRNRQGKWEDITERFWKK